jgi:hypothetical protein
MIMMIIRILKNFWSLELKTKNNIIIYMCNKIESCLLVVYFRSNKALVLTYFIP